MRFKFSPGAVTKALSRRKRKRVCVRYKNTPNGKRCVKYRKKKSITSRVKAFFRRRKSRK